MRTIIAGSHSIIYYDIIEDAIEESGFNITELVSGVRGRVSKLSERWARINNIPIKRFFPDKRVYGSDMFNQRDKLMLKYANQVIIIWDGKSIDTKNLASLTKESNLKFFLKKIGH